MWTILGIAATCTAIGIIGGVAYRLSGRVWAPILPAAMIVTGTFSTWTNDYWYSSLNSHAVIWGPFGTLFTLNAGTIGVLLVSTAIALILMYSHRVNTFLALAIAFLLGVTANIQTYSFFTGTVFSALLITTLTVLRGKSNKKLVIISATLFVLVLVMGTLIKNAIGPLPLLVLLVATLLPANLLLIRAYLPKAALYLSVFALAAAPQIIHTITGLLAKDPFLLYRQESTRELGIPLTGALISFIPLAGLSLFAFLVALRHRNKTFMAFYIAGLIGLLVMSTNDLWGFNQEPYRLWLKFTIVIAIVGAIPLAWALTRSRTIALTSLLIISVLAWLVSLVDFAGFYRYAADQGVIDFANDRSQLITEILPPDIGPESGLILASRCEDPAILKAVTGAGIADYNLGLAWPAQRDQIDQIMFSDGQITGDQLEAAGIEYILIDSACNEEWVITANNKLVVSGGGYSDATGDAVLTLIRIPSL
jgi:hypothetical protein